MDDLIEQLYDAFPVNKRLPKHLDVCTHCCMLKAEHDLLRNTDRRQISAKLLYEYNTSAKAGYFEEAANEFKHFLPRMAELFLNGEEIHHSTELNFDRFAILKKSDWSKEEINLLTEFSIQAFMTDANAWDIIDHLIMLSAFPIDITKLLDQWIDFLTLPKLCEFKSLLEDQYHWEKRKLNNCFADETLNQVFDQWLHSPQVISKITKACEKYLLDNQWDPELDALYDYLIELGKRANP